MVKLMPKKVGKVVKYNNITGYINTINNNEDIYFHEKDVINNNNILHKEVEFNMEKLQNGDKVARNIKELKK